MIDLWQNDLQGEYPEQEYNTKTLTAVCEFQKAKSKHSSLLTQNGVLWMLLILKPSERFYS